MLPHLQVYIIVLVFSSESNDYISLNFVYPRIFVSLESKLRFESNMVTVYFLYI